MLSIADSYNWSVAGEEEAILSGQTYCLSELQERDCYLQGKEKVDNRDDRNLDSKV